MRFDRNRRAVLQAAAGGLAAAWTWCCGGREAAPSGTLVVPVADLPEGARVRVVHEGRPVELHRHGGEIRARVLLCTHMGCEVRWDEGRNAYRCPCHDGLFDPDGRVIAGPPLTPLRSVDLVITDNEVRIPPLRST